jgi:hypothetical protein
MSDVDTIRRIQNLEAAVRRLQTLTQAVYAEGTWTPVFFGSTIAGTFTYTKQVGRYTRLGDTVLLRGRVAISAIAVAPTGSMFITGLPFTSANIADVYGGIYFEFISQIIYPAGKLELTSYISPNDTRIALATSQTNAAGASYPAASFTNVATDLIFAGSYQV